MDADKSPFENFSVLKVPTPLSIIKSIGRGIVSFVSLHELSPRSKHFPDVQDAFVAPEEQPAEPWNG